MEGLCGGYPGSCYPTLNYKDEQQIKIDIYEKNPCVISSPCQNGGVCAATDLETFICLCQGGFTGDHCETIEGKSMQNVLTCNSVRNILSSSSSSKIPPKN